MATEVLPASGMYALDNFITDFGTVLQQTSQESLYPASNLLNPLRSKRWRTTSGAANLVDFDLGANKGPPTVFALLDCNLDTVAAAGVALQGCDNSSFTDSPSGALLSWQMTPYIPSTHAGIVRWYLGDPDTGSAAAKRYWRVTLQASIQSGTYHELGGIWLGTYTDMKPELGAGVNNRDESPRRTVPGGATYVDRLKVDRAVGFELAALPFAEAYAKKAALDAHGAKHLLVDLHAYSTEAAVEPEAAYYGMLSPRGVSLDILGPTNNRLSISLDESRG